MRRAAWCGLCGCVHRHGAAQGIVERLELRAPAPFHPAPCRAHISAPPSAAREVRELEVRELWHAGPRSPAARSSRRSTRAAACRGVFTRAVGRAFAFRLARAAARAPLLLRLHPAALYHGTILHPAASTMQAGAHARLCHPFGRTRARYASHRPAHALTSLPHSDHAPDAWPCDTIQASAASCSAKHSGTSPRKR